LFETLSFFWGHLLKSYDIPCDIMPGVGQIFKQSTSVYHSKSLIFKKEKKRRIRWGLWSDWSVLFMIVIDKTVQNEWKRTVIW